MIRHWLALIAVFFLGSWLAMPLWLLPVVILAAWVISGGWGGVAVFVSVYLIARFLRFPKTFPGERTGEGGRGKPVLPHTKKGAGRC